MKKIIGRDVKLKLISPKTKKEITLLAKVDTGAHSTSVCTSIIKDLGYDKDYSDFLKYKEDDKDNEFIVKNIDFIKKIKKVKNSEGYSFRPYINLDIEIKGEKINTDVNIKNREHSKYRVILGRNVIKHFLVDVNLKVKDEKK